MALLDTYLQNIRAKYPSLLDRDELRMTKFGLVDSAIAHTRSPQSILSADVKQKALTSQGRLMQIPVRKKGVVTITNTRSCTLGAYESNSALIDLTWTTLVAKISMVPAQYEKNEIGYIDDLAAKLLEVKEAMLGAIEDAIYAKLDADKSTFFNSTLVGTKYPLAGNTLQVAAADWQFFFNDLRAIQAADEFYPTEHYVDGSVNLMPIVEQYMNQGPGNAVNSNFQFGDKTFRFSNGVVDAPAKRATGFMMALGSIGFLTRLDIDSRNNSKSSDGMEWGSIVLDGMPFEIGYKYKSQCSDQSALNGSGMGHLTSTLYEQWEFSVDFALATPYNSDPVNKPNVIKKFELIP
jgi:hypothetical protein